MTRQLKFDFDGSKNKCNICDKPKTPEDFDKNSHSDDGLSPFCKECRKRLYKEKYYKTNKAHYNKNRTAMIAKSLKYIKEHPEKARIGRKNYIASHPESKVRRHIRRVILKIWKIGAEVYSPNLDCTGKQFRDYIEKQFKAGMDKDNYGQWLFDFIIPLKNFDLFDKGQRRKAAHFTNIKPVWFYEIKKGRRPNHTPIT